MSRFGSDPLAFFKAVYQDTAPWDIGAPQPAMMELLERYPPEGPILDIGCGSGDLAIHLAQLSHRVVGIDFVETAIQNARSKLNALPAETSGRLAFLVADALNLSELGRTFGSVVDSGFYHLFDRSQSEMLADQVASVLHPSGRLYLHEFAIEFPVPNVPRRITAREIRAVFTADKGWRTIEIRPAEFLSRVAPPAAAICACIERLPL